MSLIQAMSQKAKPFWGYFFIVASLLAAIFLVLQTTKGQQWFEHRIGKKPSNTAQALLVLNTKISELEQTLLKQQQAFDTLTQEHAETLLRMDKHLAAIQSATKTAQVAKNEPVKMDEVKASIEIKSVTPANREFESDLNSNSTALASADLTKRQQVSRLQSVMNKMEMTALQAISQ